MLPPSPAASPLLVVGLGNPGPRYASTRHNVGYMVVDELARRVRAGFAPGPGDFWWCRYDEAERPVILVKPTTFMNGCGPAVRDALSVIGLGTETLLVVLDDFALPLGATRMRGWGSDGGHNGLASILATLATDRIPRLRCGIGPGSIPPGNAWAEFVLAPFAPMEQEAVALLITRAADAVRDVARSDLERAMSVWNM